ncbi:hypothetical protein RB600_006975 [Gaeumannomyces tritici]
MASPKLIVFGPTGDIASVAALTARGLGAHVVLAMRDPSKPIPGLAAELEARGGFERVRADLADPDSVAAAVTTTGATRAVFYVDFASTDGMLATVRALHGAGVDSPVLISSASVHNRGVPLERLVTHGADEPIARAHAAVELSLRAVYGPGGYVALRPGFFASNSRRWLGGGQLASGRVTLDFPGRVFDWIAPPDIGRVAAHVALRAGGAREVVAEAGGAEGIVLMGPRLLSGREGTQVIARAAGFGEVGIEEILDEDAAVRHMVEKQGLPEIFARTLAKHGVDYAMTEENTTVGPANVVKFGDGKITSLEEWAAAHKEAFN